jgi:hypothetical protein
VASSSPFFLSNKPGTEYHKYKRKCKQAHSVKLFFKTKGLPDWLLIKNHTLFRTYKLQWLALNSELSEANRMDKVTTAVIWQQMHSVQRNCWRLHQFLQHDFFYGGLSGLVSVKKTCHTMYSCMAFRLCELSYVDKVDYLL